MSRSAFIRASLRRSRSISCCSGFIWPLPGNADWGSASASRTHLRSTFSCTSRSRAACATATPRSRTNLTASSLNSRLNFRRCIVTLWFRKHLILVSTKPAAAQNFRALSGAAENYRSKERAANVLCLPHVHENFACRLFQHNRAFAAVAKGNPFATAGTVKTSQGRSSVNQSP